MSRTHRLSVDPSILRLSLQYLHHPWSLEFTANAESLGLGGSYSTPVGSLKGATSDRNGPDVLFPLIRPLGSQPGVPGLILIHLSTNTNV
jgi:hypothetical protein